MRLLVQVVETASVKFWNQSNTIWKWLLIYLWIGINDKIDYIYKVDKLISKLWNLKIFFWWEKIDKSIIDTWWEILIISNFTLYWTNKKWTKIDFSSSLWYNDAKVIYDYLVSQLLKKEFLVKTWDFWAHMIINSQNVWPLNYIIDF